MKRCPRTSINSSHADDAIANAVDALFDLALTLRKPWHQEAEHRINFLRAEALERRGRFKRAIAKTHLSLKPSTRSLCWASTYQSPRGLLLMPPDVRNRSLVFDFDGTLAYPKAPIGKNISDRLGLILSVGRTCMGIITRALAKDLRKRIPSVLWTFAKKRSSTSTP